MIRRHLLVLLCSCAFALGAMAQESVDSAEVGVLRPVLCAVSLQTGSVKMRDTYLTPLAYTGSSIGVRLERSRMMRSLHWASQQQFDFSFATGDIASKNSSMWAGRLRYSYALMHPWAIEPIRTHVLVGPYASAELGFDYNLKMASGNNPATVRACANVGLSLNTSTHYRIRKQDCTARLQLQTPLLGAVLMPEYGASYYETFMLQTSDHNTHFTSLHNQQDLDVRLTTDIPLAVLFKRLYSTLRLGGDYHIETMRINDITTRYSSFDLVIGWVYRYLPYHRRTSRLLNSHCYEEY